MAKEKDGGILETVKTVVSALLIAGIFRTLFFQPFWIPSGSMKDTLLVGDFLFVNKMAYGYSEHSCPFSICTFIDGRWFGRQPDRGDVVVFRHGPVRSCSRTFCGFMPTRRMFPSQRARPPRIDTAPCPPH